MSPSYLISGPAPQASTATSGTGRSHSVGQGGSNYKQGFNYVDATGKTSRKRMKLPSLINRVSDLRVRGGHWGWGGTDTPIGLLRVSVGIEHPHMSNKLYRMYLNGQLSQDVEPGAFWDTDPLSIDGYPNDTPFVRVWYRASINYATTLAAAVTTTVANAVETWTVTAAIPQTLRDRLPFYLQVDGENVLVTAADTAGTSLTFTRASSGVVAHSNGAAIKHVIQIPTDWSTDTGRLDWELDGDHVMDVNASATAIAGSAPNRIGYDPQRFTYVPSALFADYMDPPTLPVLAMIGDSNSYSFGESSFQDVAIAGRYPYLRLTVAGQSMISLGQPGAVVGVTDNTKPQHWLESVEEGGVTVAILAHGTNDKQSTTALQDQTLIQDICRSLHIRGVQKIIICTIPPTSDSTNNWIDIAGQTPSAGESIRTAKNDLRRSPGSVGADACADVTSAVEVDGAGAQVLNGGRWNNNDAAGRHLGDNVHFAPAGHTAAGAVLRDCIDRVIAGEVGFRSAAF